MSPSREMWPYPTVPVDGVAWTDVDGEDQVCECGNTSLSFDWCAADATGQLSALAAGSSDPAEYAVCPLCGRIYPNARLFSGHPTPAIGRYDTNSSELAAAKREYNKDVYGDHSAPSS